MALVKKGVDPAWVRYVRQRIRKNKNFLAFIGGPTGSGKSWAGLSICSMIDKEFDVDRCVFSGKGLMDLINSGKLKKGSAILFDEAGIDLSNRTWQSMTNRLINHLIQTFRHRNFILIFTSPYLDFIDAATRRLFHAEFATQNIDFNTKTCRMKCQSMQYNSRKKKFYFKYLRVVTEYGLVPLVTWRVPEPDKGLVAVYEEKKTAFTSQLNKNISAELRRTDKTETGLTALQEETVDMLREGYTVHEMAEMWNVTPRAVQSRIRTLNRLGVKVLPVYDKGKVVRYSVGDRENRANSADSEREMRI